MKKYMMIILLFWAFIFQHCESNPGFDPNVYSKSTVNTMDDYQFPIGTYYAYNFSSYNESINPEDEIDRLEKSNIIVEQAWYRSHLNGCSPPGAGWTTRTMYRSVFLIMLKNTNNNFSDEKYSILSNAPNIGCGYYVTTYKLK